MKLKRAGVVSSTVIRRRMRYGELVFSICNGVDRAFYQTIKAQQHY